MPSATQQSGYADVADAVDHFDLMLERGENVTFQEYTRRFPKQYRPELTRALEAVVITRGLARDCRRAGVTKRTVNSWLKPQNEEERKQVVRRRSTIVSRPAVNGPDEPLVTENMTHYMRPGADEEECTSGWGHNTADIEVLSYVQRELDTFYRELNKKLNQLLKKE